jgi:histidine ammonia-lyase
MATHGARRLADMAANSAGIVAIELLCAAQGIEYRRPLEAGVGVEAAHARVRSRVAPLHEDRILGPDLENLIELVRSGAFSALHEMET